MQLAAKFKRKEAAKGISEAKLGILTCAVVCSSEMGMHLRSVACFESTHNIGQYNNDITTIKMSCDLSEWIKYRKEILTRRSCAG